tara:strand:+ start:992 stop:1225 length:234 start_codon:yes stop_codon:yes gene_type:complete
MKYRTRYFKPEGVNLEDHFLVGTVWPVTGSKGNLYDVELHFKGFTCECIGFAHHGRCKHVKEISSRLFCKGVPEYAI